jgi:hypothetical protein
MVTLHPDLLILAATARAYGLGDASEHLYCLAHYGAQVGPAMTVSDMQAGLSLLALDSYRLVAPGLGVPGMIQDSIERGHICLAQVRGHPLRQRDYWVALTQVDNSHWHGIAIGLDWAQMSIADHMGHLLTGFYLVVAQALPDWQVAPTLP